MSLAQHLSKTEMFKSALRLQERDLHNVPPQSALFEKPLKEKANYRAGGNGGAGGVIAPPIFSKIG